MGWWGLLRVIHVLLGASWAGTMFFFVLFLEPSLRAIGPDAGKVMQALQQRRFLQTILSVGTLTVVTGAIVLWRLSSGFSAAVLMTPYGHSLMTGAILGLIALSIGFFVSRPTLQQLGKKGAAIAASGGPPSSEDAAEIARLQARLRNAARAAGALLLLTVILMAMSREM